MSEAATRRRMATLDWNLTRSEGVTLVELVVTSETTRRVRIESALSPVWPPRRQGVAIPAWDGDAVEGVVEPSAPLVVGYASPAEPVEPPATITDPAPEEGSVSPRTLVRALGDAAPPRDAVDPPGSRDADRGEMDHDCRTGTEDSETAHEPSPGDGSDNDPTGFEWGPDRRREPDDDPPSEQQSRSDDAHPDGSPTATDASLERLQCRLSALEERLDAVETAATQPR